MYPATISNSFKRIYLNRIIVRNSSLRIWSLPAWVNFFFLNSFFFSIEGKDISCILRSFYAKCFIPDYHAQQLYIILSIYLKRIFVHNNTLWLWSLPALSSSLKRCCDVLGNLTSSDIYDKKKQVLCQFWFFSSFILV